MTWEQGTTPTVEYGLAPLRPQPLGLAKSLAPFAHTRAPWAGQFPDAPTACRRGQRRGGAAAARKQTAGRRGRARRMLLAASPRPCLLGCGTRDLAAASGAHAPEGGNDVGGTHRGGAMASGSPPPMSRGEDAGPASPRARCHGAPSRSRAAACIARARDAKAEQTLREDAKVAHVLVAVELNQSWHGFLGTEKMTTSQCHR
jgi:hypothetical protein